MISALVFNIPPRIYLKSFLIKFCILLSIALYFSSLISLQKTKNINYEDISYNRMNISYILHRNGIKTKVYFKWNS